MKKYLPVLALLVVALIGGQLALAQSGEPEPPVDDSSSPPVESSSNPPVESSSIDYPPPETITGGPIKGWAWSSTIGWISLNCKNTGGDDCTSWGVSVDPATGNLSGYAWSAGNDPRGNTSGIGWIKFGDFATTPDVAGGSPGNAHMDFASGQIGGWVRACAGAADPANCEGGTNPNSGGWDGWISLSGSEYPSPDTSATEFGGVTLNTNTGNIRGFAWGSTNVGWVQFDASCAGCVGAPVLNDVAIANCSIVEQSISSPGVYKVVWEATASGGNGSYQYKWGSSSWGTSNRSTPIYVGMTTQGPIVQAKSNTFKSNSYQCPPVVIGESWGPLRLFIANKASTLSPLTQTSTGYSGATITQGEPFAVKWINNLGTEYDGPCTGSVKLPNGNFDVSPLKWTIWPTNDFKISNTISINSPSTIPTGQHQFTVKCTGTSVPDATATVKLNITSSTEIEI
jgi:hypothetical protein